MMQAMSASRVLLVGLTIAIVATTLLVSGKSKLRGLPLLDQRRRSLRFFDPDHFACGEGKISHEFGVHCLYGAINEDYYLQNTVTTDRPLNPLNRHEVEKVLRILSYVARRTQRAIRLNIPIAFKRVLEGYGTEHLQPYAVVNADILKDYGVDVVEPGYWSRATGVVMTRNKKNVEYHPVQLGAEPVATLISTSNGEEGNTANELIFSLDELLEMDSDEIGELAGTEGGYDDGTWTSFMCPEKENPHFNGYVPLSYGNK